MAIGRSSRRACRGARSQNRRPCIGPAVAAIRWSASDGPVEAAFPARASHASSSETVEGPHGSPAAGCTLYTGRHSPSMGQECGQHHPDLATRDQMKGKPTVWVGMPNCFLR